MADKKVISTEKSLMARGLFAMANTHYRKCREAEVALAELLEFEDGPYCGCLSDQIYDEDGDFDKGMKFEGFTIKATKPPRKR